MTLAELIDRFSGKRAVVLGDLMLDEYLHGSASRISPEAPVMVVRHHRTTRVPGGAANVARNISALGGKPILIGVAGDDEGGSLLEQSLHETDAGAFQIVRESGRKTTRKTRVLADFAHQVLRIDAEDDDPARTETEDALLAAYQEALEGADVVILSDYLKGTLTARVASEAIAHARLSGKPVIVNPKPRSAALYKGATLISLNRSEATEAYGAVKPISPEEAGDVAAMLRGRWETDAVLITLGGDGMVAATPGPIAAPAPRVEVADPAGAGDTVVATVALGVASSPNGVKEPAIYRAAAAMAAAVVGHVGVAAPTADDLGRVRSLG